MRSFKLITETVHELFKKTGEGADPTPPPPGSHGLNSAHNYNYTSFIHVGADLLHIRDTSLMIRTIKCSRKISVRISVPCPHSFNEELLLFSMVLNFPRLFGLSQSRSPFPPLAVAIDGRC